MSKVHVFAIDWVPAQNEIASGGGLRSLQIIECLRAAGHEVTYSVPASARHVRRIGRDSPRLRQIELFDERNQLDILRRLSPEIVFWLPVLSRDIPFLRSIELASVCDLIGLPHFEYAMGAAGLVEPTRSRLVGLCKGADLVLTGSEEQNGYWQAEFGHGNLEVPTVVVPYAPPQSLGQPLAIEPSRLKTLHVTGMIYAWSTSVHLLSRVADWVSRHPNIRLSLIAGTDPGGATDKSEIKELNAIVARLGAKIVSEVTFQEAMADYKGGSLSLDIYQPSIERRMAVPIRSVNALWHGVPVLSTIDGTFTRALQQAGAASIANDRKGPSLEAALDHLESLSASAFGQMSTAARQFAEREFNPAASSNSLRLAIDEVVDRRAMLSRTWHTRIPEVPRLGHVLVLSDEQDNLQDLRLKTPFGALHVRQQISGYSIWHRGKFAYSTSPDPRHQTFNAIWVQRHVDPEISVALATLDRPFVYDLDDNLLRSPSYRDRFSLESTQTVRHMVRACTVFSCSTARLAQLVQQAAGAFLIDKTIITPNLVREPAASRLSGTPQALIWSSTDTPALTQSRLPIVKAIRDFCLAYGLRLICIGAPPAELLIEAAIEIEQIGAVAYGEYLSLLRSLAPAILVCPLETNADQETLDFVNGKSDIKILEANSTGLIGVFSRAPPYLDTDLRPSVLCDNTYTSWFEGLTAAWQLSEQPAASPVIPGGRVAGLSGAEPWREALYRAELTKPLTFPEFDSALMLLRGRIGRRFLPLAEFDEEFYLTRYPDVRFQVDNGQLDCPYSHYRDYGFTEGRLGRAADAAGAHDQQFWANLMHTIEDLRSTVESRSLQIDMLRARRATRFGLKRNR